MGAAPSPESWPCIPVSGTLWGGMGATPSSKSSLMAPCLCPVSAGSPAPVPDPPEPGCHHVRVRLPPAPAHGRALLQALRTLRCPLCSAGDGDRTLHPPRRGPPTASPGLRPGGAQPLLPPRLPPSGVLDPTVLCQTPALPSPGPRPAPPPHTRVGGSAGTPRFLCPRPNSMRKRGQMWWPCRGEDSAEPPAGLCPSTSR